MAKEINHDAISTTATVAGSTAKGAAKGAGAVILGGLAAIALVAGVVAAAFTYPPIVIGVVAGAAVLGAIAPALGIGAAIGAGIGLITGASKVRGEQKAFDRKAKNQQQNIDEVIAQAQQQAYIAGAHDGQVQVIQKLQEIQSAQMAQQEQQTNFAANVGKKGAVTPEQIIKQREAASAAPQQLGA